MIYFVLLKSTGEQWECILEAFEVLCGYIVFFCQIRTYVQFDWPLIIILIANTHVSSWRDDVTVLSLDTSRVLYLF